MRPLFNICLSLMVFAVLIVLGLCLGSFVNALVWRLREQALPRKKRMAKDSDLSILKGRSMCVHCGHTLSSKDLIPVISWISLSGKCRYCRKPISWQYPVVELLTATLFTASYFFWANSFQGMALEIWVFGVWLLSVTVGVALALYDFKWMELPDKLVKTLLVLGIIFFVSSVWGSFHLSTIYNLLLAVFVSGGLFYILYQISDRLIGGGDVKMGLVLGLFLINPINAMMMLFLSSLLGTLYALILYILSKYKKGAHIPYGPFLLLATYLVVIFGEALVNQYEKVILLK